MPFHASGSYEAAIMKRQLSNISLYIFPLPPWRVRSLTFTVEHAAQLAVEKGLWSGVAYLLGSVLLGTAVYLMGHGWGRRW